MAKDKYEISLWEDYLVQAQNDVPAHYEEKKLAVIGSDTMTAECRAIEPKLVENINGTNTFTFKMFYVYTDRYGKEYQNPFLNLLVNERKVKVLWKNKWYDLIIKNCQEDSSGKSIIYTCKDLFINELSKTGFDLVLDNELGNNQGTAIELAKTVLENTDWSVDEVNSENVRQTKEEPVYECTTLIRAETPQKELTNENITIPNGSLILVFYQQIQDIINGAETSGTFSHFQFIYATSYQTEDNSQLVINGTDCYRATVKWRHNTSEHSIGIGNSGDWIKIYYLGGVSDRYRAARLIKSQKCVLDPLTKKYSYVYKANAAGTGEYAGLISANDEIYEYRSTEYNDPTVVNNLVVNAKDFTTTEGWSGEGITFFLYPPYDSSQDISQYTAASYLRINGQVFNAIKQSSNYIPNGFSIGEKYIFRFRAKNESGSDISTAILTPSICDKENTSTVYFNITNTVTNGLWVEYTMVCIKSITRSEIYSHNVSLMLTVSGNNVIWLGEAQLFPLVYGIKNDTSTRINPGEMDVSSVSTIYYYYYNHTTNSALLNPEDIPYLYKGTTQPSSLLNILDAQYNNDFEKIRSITAKQSNRFNILQSIAETFECWIRFVINHDSTGRVIYNEDGTPQKYVILKPEIGEEVGVGFVYGIDLKTISRTIQSDQIVTKTIVSANSNEFATDGFCTIARSIENYPRTNFILNFDYYISQGLLNAGEVNKDLYLSTEDSIGYYYHLNQCNKEYDEIGEFLTQKQTELLKQKGFLTVYEATMTSLEEQINNYKSELTLLAGATSYAGATEYIKANSEAEQVQGRMTAIANLEQDLADYTSRYQSLQSSVTALESTIEAYKTNQEELVDAIKAKHLEFYKKYSRYIQEGSWISEDYIDDNLYYLDALSVAYTSSRPQISYNISVLRLSSLEEFKNKVFHLGDISFIQDTEFFGYTTDSNGIRTPYKEKVLVAEITSNFDSPDQDSFKVQNYKTQFEDLFQRITSTTQSLQYASGEYARAASVVETDGTIKGETLQASIELNEQLVYSAQNESIINDSTGITVTDTTNPNKKTKITSGGVFITTDGGETWKNAVRGEGIATQYLTAGLINVNNINIMDGTFTTFRWDSNGINAYVKHPSDYGEVIDLSQFVRFDHYGIYGVKESLGSAFVPSSIEDVFAAADFGLTWDGFFIKNKYDDHLVEISSENDIQVVDTSNSVARVKIGKITDSQFGIQLKDESGHVTLQTADNGTLWLEDRLNISSTSDNYNIGIGYLSATSNGVHEVINANDSFIVYEDGSMKATNGEFTGTIYATGGSIGNMSIDQIEYSAYEVIIESNNGTIFKNGAGSKLLTAHLYKSGTEIMGTTYSWYSGNSQVGTNSSTYTVVANPSQDVYTISCVVTV